MRQEELEAAIFWESIVATHGLKFVETVAVAHERDKLCVPENLIRLFC